MRKTTAQSTQSGDEAENGFNILHVKVKENKQESLYRKMKSTEPFSALEAQQENQHLRLDAGHSNKVGQGK